MLAALGVAACSRTHFGPGAAAASAQDELPAGAGGRSPANDNAGGSGSSSVVMHDAAIEPIGDDATPDDVLPEDELPSREIWIGELWSIAPLLCDPNAPWQSTPIVVEPVGYTEPVVLVLEPGSDGSVPSGVIAFGQGDLPQEPGPAATAMGDSGSFWLCSIQIPSKGGEYSLLDARRGDERLTFDITPSEIWTKDCDGEPRDCFECSSSTCSLVGRRVELDLVIQGDTIEGTFQAAAFGTPGELRLQRMP